MTQRKLAGLAGALAALFVLGTALPAAAAPRTVGRDSADNGFSFSYDAEAGEITQGTSSLRFVAQDRVNYLTSFDLAAAPAEGQRLVAKISLKLFTQRVTVYDGTFKVVIEAADGTRTVLSKVAKVTLRPEPGARTARLSFRIDLPSGDYDVTSSFVSAP